jgi:hypothetical protein
VVLFVAHEFESDCLDESNQRNRVLSFTDGSPLSLLFELALKEIGTLSEYQRVGFLDIVVQSCSSLDVGINKTFEDHLLGFFRRSQSCRDEIDRRDRLRNSDLEFVYDGGPDVSTVFIFGSNVFGDTFESMHESVSLFVVAAIEDMALEFGTVASEL